MKLPAVSIIWARVFPPVAILLCLVAAPLLIAMTLMRLWHFDFSLPIAYNGGDAAWQFILTKMLFDTGWILNNPYLGAPDIAHWHANASAQTSALHSVIMRGLKFFVSDAISLQQVYFMLNFPLIAITSFVAARLIGVGRWPACCVGLLFAFSTFRLSSYIYAYLSNCFIVPLSVVPPIWILTGRVQGSWRVLLQSRSFWVSVIITVLAALTDGYYAFFTLLFIGFAGSIRFLTQRTASSLLAPTILAAALITSAYSLAWPLRSYERAHQAEFLINGKPDPAVVKHPFEAEVYSSSLKLMLTPIQTHRIPQVAGLASWIVETSNRARAFPSGVGGPLGALASGLLLGALLLTIIRTTYARNWPFSTETAVCAPEFGAILALVLLSFLCATTGGLGAIVALVYPTIRAYDRVTLFVTILLYLGGGLLLTQFLSTATARGRVLTTLLTLVVVPLAILDQSPNNLGLRDTAKLARFVAERDFIRKIEASVPAGTQIYQYPYSNYLINSPYYGWGAFAHVRFYLHSHRLRWSNGAFKNSPVDNWHLRLAALPLDQLITEVRAAGFGGILVDRTVVGDAEYDRFRDEIVARTGVQPALDEASQLAFWRLPPFGYRIVYGPDYQEPTQVVVHDPQAIAPNDIDRSLDPSGFQTALKAMVASATPGKPVVIDRSAHPDVFSDMRLADAGLGLVPLQPASPLRVDVLCPAQRLVDADDVLTLTLHNRSPVDMRLNSGPAPLRVGLQQVAGSDGAQLRGDGGYRVPGSPSIKPGASITLKVPLAPLDLWKDVPATTSEITAVFALVQEGVTWLGPAQGDGECRMPLRRHSAPAE